MSSTSDRSRWSDRVIYQVYPRSFADGDGDGMGDLAGLHERIDHLVWLGVGAVWLSPFFPSGGVDGGYDVSDYRAIDAHLGTLDDFDRLVEDLHRHDIKVVIDQVYNHTSDEHAWFVDALADGPRRDWYVWRPPRPGSIGGNAGAEPSDLRSVFGGPAWSYDDSSGEYYLHLFDRRQPDLNWESPDLRHAVHDTMRWWLDRGVDGFRLDVINLISKPTNLVERNESDPIRAVVNGPRLVEYLAEMRRAIDHDRPHRTLLIGETPDVDPIIGERLTDPGSGALDMLLQFEHVELDRGESKWSPIDVDVTARLTTIFDRWQRGLRNGWHGLYWSNHDQPRAVARFGDPDRWRARSAKTLATVLHLQRGTPFVYQGEEIAMSNYPFADLGELDDVEAINFASQASRSGLRDEEILAAVRRTSRDNARTPMQWGPRRTGELLRCGPLPANPDTDVWNVARQRDNETSVLQHYRWLLRLRRDDPIVAEGTYEPVIVGDSQVFAFVRQLGSRRLLIVANLSGRPARFDRAVVAGMELAASEPAGRGVADDGRELEPWESRVYRNQGVTTAVT